MPCIVSGTCYPRAICVSSTAELRMQRSVHSCRESRAMSRGHVETDRRIVAAVKSSGGCGSAAHLLSLPTYIVLCTHHQRLLSDDFDQFHTLLDLGSLLSTAHPLIAVTAATISWLSGATCSRWGMSGSLVLWHRSVVSRRHSRDCGKRRPACFFAPLQTCRCKKPLY